MSSESSIQQPSTPAPVPATFSVADKAIRIYMACKLRVYGPNLDTMDHATDDKVMRFYHKRESEMTLKLVLRAITDGNNTQVFYGNAPAVDVIHSGGRFFISSPGVYHICFPADTLRNDVVRSLIQCLELIASYA